MTLCGIVLLRSETTEITKNVMDLLHLDHEDKVLPRRLNTPLPFILPVLTVLDETLDVVILKSVPMVFVIFKFFKLTFDVVPVEIFFAPSRLFIPVNRGYINQTI